MAKISERLNQCYTEAYTKTAEGNFVMPEHATYMEQRAYVLGVVDYLATKEEIDYVDPNNENNV